VPLKSIPTDRNQPHPPLRRRLLWLAYGGDASGVGDAGAIGSMDSDGFWQDGAAVGNERPYDRGLRTSFP
jgi:hypothetical protein